MRKTREDWLNQGLEVLSSEGFTALTIDHMVSRLGVTKGSFYHHFKNRAAFSEALLTHWEQKMTLDFIQVSDREGEPLERIHKLSSLVETGDHIHLEVAIRVWALQDPLARRFQEAVDARRLAYCRELAVQLTGSEDRGALLGTLVFTAFLGAQQMLPALDTEENRRLQHFIIDQFTQ